MRKLPKDCPTCPDDDCTDTGMLPRSVDGRGRGTDMNVASDLFVDEEDWRSQVLDPDEVIARRDQAQARTQELHRTNPMFAGNLRTERAATVGAKVRFQYDANIDKLNRARQGTNAAPLDEVWLDEFATIVEDEWEADMEDPYRNWLDATGFHTFSGQLGLAFMELSHSGEVFGVFETDTSSREEFRPFPSVMSLIDSVRLSTPTKYLESPYIRNGQRIDRFGRTISWYVERDFQYPAGCQYPLTWAARRARDSKEERKWDTVKREYSWGKPKAFHFYDRERVNQIRAVPAFASALKRTLMVDLGDEAIIDAAIRDAAFALWVESDNVNLAQAFGSHAELAPAEVVEQVLGAHQDARNAYRQNAARRVTMNSKDVPQLMVGEEVKSLRPANLKTGHADIAESFLMHASRAMEIDLSSYTGDYRGMSYTNMTAALMNTWMGRYFKRDKLFCALGVPTFEVWFEEKIARGHFDMPIPVTRSRLRHLDFYYKNRRALSMVTFHGMAQEHIDPIKGQKSWESRINNRMGSLTQWYNNHTETTLRRAVREQRREERMFKKAGLDYAPGATSIGTQANDRVSSSKDDGGDKDETDRVG